MAITDAQRHRLHNKLDQVLGEEDAAVLISHLPPSGWSDVARTSDLDELERRIETRADARFAVVDSRFAVVDSRFETMEARFGAAIERSMREQMGRFLVGVGVLMTVVSTIQTVVITTITG